MKLENLREENDLKGFLFLFCGSYNFDFIPERKRLSDIETRHLLLFHIPSLKAFTHRHSSQHLLILLFGNKIFQPSSYNLVIQIHSIISTPKSFSQVQPPLLAVSSELFQKIITNYENLGKFHVLCIISVFICRG